LERLHRAGASSSVQCDLLRGRALSCCVRIGASVRTTCALLFLLMLAFTGCMMIGMREPPQQPVDHARDEWIREEWTFGSDIPGGGTVTESDWQRFLAEVVTPRFPNGFSVSNGYGQYRMKNGEIVKEKNWVVVVYFTGWSPEHERAIEEVLETYKRWFRQESVMRAISTARVEFKD
jgi:hypothetical protein